MSDASPQRPRQPRARPLPTCDKTTIHLLVSNHPPLPITHLRSLLIHPDSSSKYPRTIHINEIRNPTTMTSWTPKSDMPDLRGKVIMVTGARYLVIDPRFVASTAADGRNTVSALASRSSSNFVKGEQKCLRLQGLRRGPKKQGISSTRLILTLSSRLSNGLYWILKTSKASAIPPQQSGRFPRGLISSVR